MVLILVVSSLVLIPCFTLFTGFPLPSSLSFPHQFTTTGDVRSDSQTLSLLIGPEKSSISELSPSLLSSLELDLQSPIDYGTTLTIDIDDAASGRTLFWVTVTPPNVVVTGYTPRVYNETCEYGFREEVRKIWVTFGVPIAKVEYEGNMGRKPCAELPFSGFALAVTYTLTAASAKPKTVIFTKIQWEAAVDPFAAVTSLQENTLKFVREVGKTLRTQMDLLGMEDVLSQLRSLGDEIEVMEQRLVSLSMRWESLKPTEYMTRPEHLIHHFRIVLRDLDREVTHLYDRITHGALSEYAERFIHERKEVMPMEVLLGAYAWQVEKKLGDLKTHIATMERFTWVIALAAGLVLAGLITALLVRKAEKLHKL